jgi:3-oxoacyl-ACP reductase-like protein
MGIFSKIKDAIFGKKAEAATPAPAAPATTAAPAAPQPVPAAPVAISEVDVEAILSAQAANAGQELNWRTSIVDLMKLLDIDPSLDNRKELATELGYTGDLDGSAEMNIWLHKAVMRELAANGGTVPADLTD